MKVRGFGKNIYYYFFFHFYVSVLLKVPLTFTFLLLLLFLRYVHGSDEEKKEGIKENILRENGSLRRWEEWPLEIKKIYIFAFNIKEHIFGDIFTQIMKLTAVTWRCTLIFLH